MCVTSQNKFNLKKKTFHLYLLPAKPGMGKTCSMAYLALKWVKEPGN